MLENFRFSTPGPSSFETSCSGNSTSFCSSASRLTVANCAGHANDAASFAGSLACCPTPARANAGDATLLSSAVNFVRRAPCTIRPEATGWVTSTVMRGTIG